MERSDISLWLNVTPHPTMMRIGQRVRIVETIQFHAGCGVNSA